MFRFGGKEADGRGNHTFHQFFTFLIAFTELFSEAYYPGDQQILALSETGRRQSRSFLILHSGTNLQTHKSKHRPLRGANSNASAVRTEQKGKDNLQGIAESKY